jgi:peroxiredoxin
VKRDPVVIVVVAVLVTVMLVFGYKMAGKGPAKRASAAGQPAPDFSLQSIEGKTLHLSDLRGKAVVVNFWATWCQPCKIEMPWFVELQKQYGPEGLQIVGISADEDTTADELGKFTKEMGINYPILLGKEEVEQAYGGIQFLPVTVFVDRDGKIVDKVYGLKGRAEIEDNIKKSLAKGQTTQAHK